MVAGESTEFVFEFTKLVEDSENPGTVRRAYLTVDGLDLLSVDAGPPPAYADIPYTTPKYTADVGEEPGQWHNGRYVSGPERYFGVLGQYFAQSSDDPNAMMPFPLDVGADVAPGDYTVTVRQSGGRPLDPLYFNGWTVLKTLTLTVLPASTVPVPEPGSLLLLATAAPVVWLGIRRRRRRIS